MPSDENGPVATPKGWTSYQTRLSASASKKCIEELMFDSDMVNLAGKEQSVVAIPDN